MNLRMNLHLVLWNVACGIADPHNLDADPNPHPSIYLIRLFTWMLILVKVIQIGVHWSTDPPKLCFEPPRLHCERLRTWKAPFWASQAYEYPDLDLAQIMRIHVEPDPQPWLQVFCMHACIYIQKVLAKKRTYWLQTVPGGTVMFKSSPHGFW